MAEKRKIQRMRSKTDPGIESIQNSSSSNAFGSSAGSFLNGVFVLPKIKRTISRTIASSETKWTEFFAKAFMERGYWRKIRTGDFKEAVAIATQMFMKDCISNRKRMCGGLMLLDPDSCSTWFDSDYCDSHELEENTGLVGLHFGQMIFNTYRLKAMEDRYPGLGSYILALLEKLPVSVSTPHWTLENISWMHWGGEDDFDDYQNPDEYDMEGLYRKDVEKLFDSWMLDTNLLFNESPIGSYKGGFPSFNEWFCEGLTKVEDSLERYHDSEHMGFVPSGIDIPGINLNFGKRDQLSERILHDVEEHLGQMCTSWYSGYLFEVDDKTDMQAVFDEIELVTECVNNAVDLLLAIEYIDLNNKNNTLVKILGAAS